MQMDETVLFQRISEIIKNRKTRAGAYANREIILMFWEVGTYIDSGEFLMEVVLLMAETF